MLESRILTITFDMPFALAYDYMSEPRNIPAWTPIPAETFLHLADRDFAAELPVGPVVMRFCQLNPFGVLDYWVTPQGSNTSRYVPARLFANGEGCELHVVLLRQPGMTEEAFASQAEWITADLLTMKSLLESAG
jgi:hypothetical protein